MLIQIGFQLSGELLRLPMGSNISAHGNQKPFRLIAQSSGMIFPHRARPKGSERTIYFDGYLDESLFADRRKRMGSIHFGHEETADITVQMGRLETQDFHLQGRSLERLEGEGNAGLGRLLDLYRGNAVIDRGPFINLSQHFPQAGSSQLRLILESKMPISIGVIVAFIEVIPLEPVFHNYLRRAFLLPFIPTVRYRRQIVLTWPGLRARS